MAAEVGPNALGRVQEGTCKPVAAVLLVPLGHVGGQVHHPVAQLVRGGEADAFAGAAAVQRDQHVVLVVGGGAGAVKAVVVVHQRHLDAVLLQQLPASGSQHDGPRSPLEQRDAELFLELLDLMADGRGRQRQTFRRILEARMSSRNAESSQQPQRRRPDLCNHVRSVHSAWGKQLACQSERHD